MRMKCGVEDDESAATVALGRVCAVEVSREGRASL